jgi:hypothetical protein
MEPTNEGFSKRSWVRPSLVELGVAATLSSPSPAQAETRSQQPDQVPGGPS